MKKIITILFAFVLTLPFEISAQKLEIRRTEFKNFFPKTMTNTAYGFFQEYLNDPSYIVGLDDTALVRRSKGASKKFLEEHKYKLLYFKSDTVSDQKKFTNDVLNEASKLGYSKDSISKLNIHDLILLSGEITFYKFEYDNAFDTYKNKAEVYADETFNLGKGVCYQFSLINTLVFRVLSKHNSASRGTYMKMLGIGNHAVNEILTVSGTPDNLVILACYVNPTDLIMDKKGNLGLLTDIRDSYVSNLKDKKDDARMTPTARKNIDGMNKVIRNYETDLWSVEEAEKRHPEYAIRINNHIRFLLDHY